jgi:excinuclease ABC subunit C
MLQRLRDEAHRFALTYHRQLRGKQAIVSMLDQIPGVGKARRTALLKHFGSVVEMKEASLDDLAKAPGMNKAVAAALFAALHEEDTPDGDANGDGQAISPAARASLEKGTRSLSDMHPDPQGRFMATNVIGRRKR